MSLEQAEKITLKNSRIPKGFFLRKSKTIGLKVPGGVLGLWTDSDICKGNYIGEYVGKKLKYEDAMQMKSKYLFTVHNKPNDKRTKIKFVLDGQYKKYSSFIRYANAADSYEDQNTIFEQVDDRIFLKAIKNIPANTEILTHYGEGTSKIVAEGYTEIE